MCDLDEIDECPANPLDAPTTSSPEQLMCKPQSHKRSFSVIPPHLSKEGEGKKRNLWSERGKNDITRQIQNNSFTVTSLTFLRFPVKWKPADIHFASPAIVRSGRPAYPSCCAA